MPAASHPIRSNRIDVVRPSRAVDSVREHESERQHTEAKLRSSEERLEILHEIDRALLSAHSASAMALVHKSKSRRNPFDGLGR